MRRWVLLSFFRLVCLVVGWERSIVGLAVWKAGVNGTPGVVGSGPAPLINVSN